MRYLLTLVLLAGLLLGCNNEQGAQTTEIGPPTRTLDQLSPSDSHESSDRESAETTDTMSRESFDPPPAATYEARQPDEPLPPEVVPGSQTYVVKRGDTLWSISQRLLGDGQRWREIVEMNAGLVPEDMRIGQTLRIPAR